MLFSFQFGVYEWNVMLLLSLGSWHSFATIIIFIIDRNSHRRVSKRWDALTLFSVKTLMFKRFTLSRARQRNFARQPYSHQPPASLELAQHLVVVLQGWIK